MKILQVALGKQEDIRDALSTLGDVVYWDWSGRHKTFSRDLRSLVDFHNPNIIFMQIQTDNILDKYTAAHISQKAFTINWTGDVRAPLPKWFKDIAPNIDITLFTNMNDVEHMRSLGFKSDYLQVGFPTKIFKPKGEIKPCSPIIFMGNNPGGFPLSSYRKQMIDVLKKRYGEKFSLFGTGWPGHHYITDQFEEAKHYRGAKIAINLSHFNYSRYSSDRIFRIMGAGTMCLSHKYPGIEHEFEIGNHLDVWENFEELFKKIDYYLDKDNERKRIADLGCKHVHNNHNWTNRINELKKMLPND